MQFDWTTFALEVINFLVLLWILKRFLYRPVLAAIDARRDAVSRQEESLQTRQREAEALKSQYEALLKAWPQERDEARRRLDEELSRQKAAGRETIRRELDAERETVSARMAVAAATKEAEVSAHAIETAYRRVSEMLQRLASPAITLRIVDVFLEDLPQLGDADRAMLSKAAMSAEHNVVIETAHAIGDETRQRLSRGLSDASGTTPAPAFEVRPELIAGIRVSFGQCLLKADLADELRYFMERDLHV
ncbi:MAG TPA: F0F1 ATP synthase subunit delta [Noviherbaspirillum sp.]